MFGTRKVGKHGDAFAEAAIPRIESAQHRGWWRVALQGTEFHNLVSAEQYYFLEDERSEAVASDCFHQVFEYQRD